MRKSFFRNGLLISFLIGCAVFLSAQVKQSPGGSNTYAKGTITDSLAPVDNSEGFQELNQIIKRYEVDNLYLSGEIRLYENADSLTSPSETSPFTTIITASANSFELDSVQTIANDQLTLQIDKKEKSIAIIEKDSAGGIQAPVKGMATQLKEMQEYISSVKVSLKGSDKVLRIEFNDKTPSNVILYEITYVPATYQVKKVSMQITDGELSDTADQQSEDNQLVMVDENKNEIETGYYADVKVNLYEWIYKTERKTDPQMLNLSRFVNKINGEYKLNSTFKNFELLN